MTCNYPTQDFKFNVATTIETQPTIEPVELESVKEFLRVTNADSNAQIKKIISAVRVMAEKLSGRAFITQTWKSFYAGWPAEYFSIPYPTLQSITSIKYKDTDGDQTTWDTDQYIVDIDKEPGRVTLGYSLSWPSTTLYPSNPIEIEFICGYGDDVDDVPEDVQSMIMVGVEEVYHRPDKESYAKLLKGIWQGYLMNSKVYGF